MSGIFRVMKYSVMTLVAAALLFAAASPSYADTGSVRVTVTRAGFIIGVGGGTGTLHLGEQNLSAERWRHQCRDMGGQPC